MLEIKNFTQEENLRSCGVYLISHDCTNLKYVGSTYQKYGFKGRWLTHLNGLIKGVGNRVLINIYKKYGIEGFKFSILEVIYDINILRERELFWINYLDTYNNGCNVSLNTEQPILGFKRLPITDKHKRILSLISKTKKKVYLYTFEGDLENTFESSCECDRYFKLKKGRTSYIISSKSNQKTLQHKFIPSYKKIEKEDWVFNYGHTIESRRISGSKHKGKTISKNTIEKIRLNNKLSMKIDLYSIKDSSFLMHFNSLNECDDFLNMTRGCTSKVLKGKAKALKRTYIPKIIC